ncbi:uncharacterized protein LOC111705760 isoform X2 [Eurytemora carolleeae]|uniref:uncharacterized protein LOC111705760 isoform X2 n=1 Tax=Eurytemora carolleeae TaxID=1294199 RepID=UPI000C76E4BD|nr:uncharacterized protein LOC111705760 isoform X2 [Eurytemora carolleeae]|eukprot:XP_023334178.1 uncharacterized protein LOC111705760 isoform X2 [Eurytemora affinis]
MKNIIFLTLPLLSFFHLSTEQIIGADVLKKCCSPGSVLDDWYRCVETKDIYDTFTQEISEFYFGEIETVPGPPASCSTRKLQEFMVELIIIDQEGDVVVIDHQGNNYTSFQYECVDKTLSEKEVPSDIRLLVCEQEMKATEGFIKKCCPHGEILNNMKDGCTRADMDDGTGWIPPRHILNPETGTATGTIHVRLTEFPFVCGKRDQPETMIPSYLFTNGEAITFHHEQVTPTIVQYHCADRFLMDGFNSISDPLVLFCKNQTTSPARELEMTKCCSKFEMFSVADESCIPDHRPAIDPRSLFSEDYIGLLENDASPAVSTIEGFSTRSGFTYGEGCQVKLLEEAKKYVFLLQNNTIFIKGEVRSNSSIYSNYCIDTIAGLPDTSDNQIGIVLCAQDRLKQDDLNNHIFDLITGHCEHVFFKHLLGVLAAASIVCLVVTIIVYISLPSLQTIHGKIIISNSIAVILVMFFFILSLSVGNISGSLSCILLGYIIYYSSLSMFIWMSIMCADILLTFMNPSIHSTSSVHKKFNIYSTVGWITPLLFSLVILILDNVLPASNIYKPMVGQDVCFIQQTKEKQELYFFLPILLMLISNLIMFIMFVWKLWNHKKTTFGARQSRRKSTIMTNGVKTTKPSKHTDQYKDIKEQFILFSKMFIVLGVLWILECIHFFNHSNNCEKHGDMAAEIFFRIFDVLNQLRGVFIFLIFVFKKTIWEEIKRLPVLKRIRKNETDSLREHQGRKWPKVINIFNTLSVVFSTSSPGTKKKNLEVAQVQILSAKSTESLSNISQGSAGTKNAVKKDSDKNEDNPSSEVGQSNIV